MQDKINAINRGVQDAVQRQDIRRIPLFRPNIKEIKKLGIALK